ncbi:Major facilitator superfamily domain-containing protein 4A [Halotydeus destructor]|nr:Major facilitator superfamily domain-containing protein 4A [Halotydeus destructor]
MGIFIQITENKHRFVKLTSLFLSFIAIGLNNGLTGPTLLDLQCQVNQSYDQILWLVPIRAGGYATGSAITAIAYSYINPMMITFIALVISGATAFVTPLARQIVMLFTFQLINGIASGMMDSAGNVFCLELWGKENQPFMQALHFMFGIGGLISPLIVSQYLVPLVSMSRLNSSELMEPNIIMLEGNVTCNADNLNLGPPYQMISGYCFLASLLALYLFVFHRHTSPHPSRLEKKEDGATSTTVDPKVRALVWVLTALFCHIYLGLEIAMGSLLTTFAVKSDLHLTKVTGAYMTSVYWSTFTFFRIAAVAYIGYVGPYYNIIFELGLVILSNLFLVPFGNSVEWCLWVGVALLGLGVSSIWASVFGFVENYFPVTSKMASTFTVSACLGEFVFPFLMGYFAEHSPQGFFTDMKLFLIFGLFICACVCSSGNPLYDRLQLSDDDIAKYLDLLGIAYNCARVQIKDRASNADKITICRNFDLLIAVFRNALGRYISKMASKDSARIGTLMKDFLDYSGKYFEDVKTASHFRPPLIDIFKADLTLEDKISQFDAYYDTAIPEAKEFTKKYFLHMRSVMDQVYEVETAFLAANPNDVLFTEEDWLYEKRIINRFSSDIRKAMN